MSALKYIFNLRFYRFLKRTLSVKYALYIAQENLRQRYPDARVDMDCKVVGPERVFLGKQVKIDRHCYLNTGGISAYHREGEIHLGHQVLLGNSVHVFSVGGKVVIGENSRIGLRALLTTTSEDSFANPEVPPSAHVHVSEDILIGKNCMIAGGSIILGGTILGDYCIVGAGAVVKGKYPDKSTIIGNPARAIPRIAFQTS